MILFKKNFNLKTMLIAFSVFASALLLDATFSSAGTEYTHEARFLGIGKKTTYGPCENGFSEVTITYTIFWIPVSSGKSLTGC